MYERTESSRHRPPECSGPDSEHSVSEIAASLGFGTAGDLSLTKND